MEVTEHSSVLLPAHIVLEQVAWPVGLRVSSHHILLLANHLVLHGREASIGSRSSVHITAGP